MDIYRRRMHRPTTASKGLEKAAAMMSNNLFNWIYFKIAYMGKGI